MFKEYKARVAVAAVPKMLSFFFANRLPSPNRKREDGEREKAKSKCSMLIDFPPARTEGGNGENRGWEKKKKKNSREREKTAEAKEKGEKR